MSSREGFFIDMIKVEKSHLKYFFMDSKLLTKNIFIQHFSIFSLIVALLEARGLPAHLFGSLGPRMHLLLHQKFNNGASRFIFCVYFCVYIHILNKCIFGSVFLDMNYTFKGALLLL